MFVGAARSVTWSDRRAQRRQLVRVGVPVGRGLWHPLSVGAAWLVAFVPVMVGVAFVGGFYARRIEDFSAITYWVGFVIYGAILYWVLACLHVGLQAFRRWRDRHRVRQEIRFLAGVPVDHPAGSLPARERAAAQERRIRGSVRLSVGSSLDPSLHAREYDADARSMLLGSLDALRTLP